MGISGVKVDGKCYSSITVYGIYQVQEGNLDFKPIPLSEEWLLKFGFERTANDSDNIISYTNGKIGLNCYKHESQDYYWLRYYQGHINKKMYYVHELQNTHHAVAGTELKLGE